MGLGNLGLSGFTPKASKTAESLLATPTVQEHKKQAVIQLRISEDVFTLFKEECEARGTTMSAALRAYIDRVIAGGLL